MSVVVPVYNSESYLERCLDSLVGQSLEALEIVLVDDGSTDSSPAIMRRYAEQFGERIKVYTKENGGQATARNLGIKKCNGAYIGFVDSDDYVDSAMYETMYEQAVKNDSDFVECLYHCVEEGPKGMKNRRTRGHIRAYKDKKDMLIDPQVSPWNKLYRKELLQQPGLCFPEGVIYEDTAFYIKTIPYINKSSFVDRRFVYYVLRANSTMTANKSRRVGDIFFVLDDILSFYKEQGLFEEYKTELEYFCVKILFCSSLSRIGRGTDKDIKNELLDMTFSWVGSHFPEYKGNPYFAGTKTGLYVRYVTRANSGLLAYILGKTMKG